MFNENKDLRVVKTKKLIFDAMLNLISRRKFDRITVNEICKKAQISRATFYVHFEDKYDLLRIWLTDYFLTDVHRKIKSLFLREKEFRLYMNTFVDENKKIITNLLIGADSEAMEIISDVILSLFSIAPKNRTETDVEYIVLSNIYVGGIISYLKWQVKNEFPGDVKVFNKYLYDIVKKYLHL